MKTEREQKMIEYLQTVREVQSGTGQKNTQFPFISIEDYLLKNGKFFRTDPSIKVHRGEMKECFMNAQRLAQMKGYRYVEGYASGIIPTLHAWVINEHDVVLDPTWNDEDAVYFGVVIPMAYVLKVNLLRKAYGVLDAWEIDYPLLTGKHKLSDYNERDTFLYQP
jgi:hypothetical protein